MKKKPPHRAIRFGILILLPLVMLLTSPLVFAREQQGNTVTVSSVYASDAVAKTITAKPQQLSSILELANQKLAEKNAKLKADAEAKEAARVAELARIAALPKPRPPSTTTQRLTTAIFTPRGTCNYGFAYGQCTYGVSRLRCVTWSGNAINWLANARAQGYPTGSTPRVNSIMVSRESNIAGHVALVTAVYADGSFRVTEMNAYFNGGGFGRYSWRVITPGSIYILGFVY